VQRIVNEMIGEGALALTANPHHRRAKLVVLTDRGARLYEAIEKRRLPWTDALAEGLSPRTIASALTTLRALRDRLEA
jgi:DNA-binding MarR family transcriptional regulator